MTDRSRLILITFATALLCMIMIYTAFEFPHVSR